MKMITAYHFLRADMCAGAGEEAAWEIGETRTVADPSRIELCGYGYHSCATLFDALSYAPGPMACLVRVSAPAAHDENKQVSATRQLVHAVNIERELRLFAADCAERVLYIFEREYPKDQRPRLAIQAARDFAAGTIGTAAGNAARDAAWAAAGNAAGAAAWDAAWDAAWAAAWDAARDAARDAAWAAAGNAAGAAAWDAAWDAAWAAAWDAAWAAEKSWQRAHFDAMFGGLFKDEAA